MLTVRNPTGAEQPERSRQAALRRPRQDAAEAPRSPASVTAERMGKRLAPIAASRRRIPVVHLPDPDHVPSSKAIRATLSPNALAACRTEFLRQRPNWRRLCASLTWTKAEETRQARTRLAFMVETGQPADPGTHDEFFRIHRAVRQPAETFILGLFRALAILREDVEGAPTRVEPERIAQLASALDDALWIALGCGERPARRTFQKGLDAAPESYSAKRWIRGHQLFAVLSQALIFALNELAAADEAGCDGTMRQSAALMSHLLDASACALELTGDFPEAIYSASIRTSMESPFLPEGFSGLLSNDHRQLVIRMKALRPTIERLRERHPDSHAQIFAALDGVYKSHKHVCARFVGPEQSSLLMAQSSGRSAVEQIERFRQMRLRSWGPCHDGG